MMWMRVRGFALHACMTRTVFGYNVVFLTIEVCNAIARTSWVAISFGMNTICNVSNTAFLISGRFLIIVSAALKCDEKFVRIGILEHTKKDDWDDHLHTEATYSWITWRRNASSSLESSFCSAFIFIFYSAVNKKGIPYATPLWYLVTKKKVKKVIG